MNLKAILKLTTKTKRRNSWPGQKRKLSQRRQSPGESDILSKRGHDTIKMDDVTDAHNDFQV